MDRRDLLLMFGAAATATRTVVDAAQVPAAAAVPGLLGAWRLRTYEDMAADGTTVLPYGSAPAGLLIYLASGHMAVQIMKVPPPEVATDDWDRFTPAERIALYDGYVAYFGRFEIDTARGAVIHLAEADLSRLYIGRREERFFTLSGDVLTLRETWEQGGRRWRGTRTFDRVR